MSNQATRHANPFIPPRFECRYEDRTATARLPLPCSFSHECQEGSRKSALYTSKARGPAARGPLQNHKGAAFKLSRRFQSIFYFFKLCTFLVSFNRLNLLFLTT